MLLYTGIRKKLFVFSAALMLVSILYLVPISSALAQSPVLSVERIEIGTQMIENSRRITARISADARYVAYQNTNDPIFPERIYRHDRMTGISTVVSVSSTGEEADPNFGVALEDMSADGRFVVFHSAAGNLVPDDTNGFIDIFVHDTVTGETIRASVSSTGAEANAQDFGSNGAKISADGRFVVF